MQVAPISTSKGPGLGGEPHMFFYPESEADVAVVQYSTTAGASAQLTNLVAAAAKAAIKERGSFAIALTGMQSGTPDSAHKPCISSRIVGAADRARDIWLPYPGLLRAFIFFLTPWQ